MIEFDATVPVKQLMRAPEDALYQGLAVVDLVAYDCAALSFVSEVARFARHLDTIQRPEVDASPRRVSVPGEEMALMEAYGKRFASMLLPLTQVAVERLIRGRFLVYTEIGAATPEHIDDPLDDDHVLSVGVDLIGSGVLRANTYTRQRQSLPGHHLPSERTPIRLEPGVAVVQRGQATVSHEAASYDAYRVVGIWDFAG